MTDILSFHKKLLLSASPSGFEGDIAKAIINEARKNNRDVFTDVLGNVICHIKGKGKKLLFSSHADVVGFMVKGIDEKGFLRIVKLGSPRPFAVINAKVRFKNGTRGIIRVRELQKTVKRAPSDLTFDDLYVDIGAKTRESAEKLAQTGDVCVFDGECAALSGSRYMTPYADDLLGCAVLLSVMETCRKGQNDLYFVFSAQEEVGCRGAAVAAEAVRPDIAVNCDVAVAGDDPQSKKDNNSLTLGAGAAIKLFDASVIPQTGLAGLLFKVADIEKIPCQKEISERIGTDASSVQLSGSGVCAAGVSIPVRNLHTPVETFDINDAQNAARLISAFARVKFS